MSPSTWDYGSAPLQAGINQNKSGKLEVRTARSSAMARASGLTRAFGQVLLSGQNTEWRMGAGALALGESGSGMLDVSAGARVLSEGGWLGCVRAASAPSCCLARIPSGGRAPPRWCWATAASAPWRWRRPRRRRAPRCEQLGALGVASIDDAGSEWTTGSQLIVVGASSTGMLTIAGEGKLTSGSIRVADVLLLPGTASDSTVTIRSGGMVETGQLDAWDSARASVDIDGGILRLTRNQPGLFAGFRDGKVLLGAGG